MHEREQIGFSYKKHTQPSCQSPSSGRISEWDCLTWETSAFQSESLWSNFQCTHFETPGLPMWSQLKNPAARESRSAHNGLLRKCLSLEYLRIIDDSSFLIHYKTKDLKTRLTKVSLFLEVQNWRAALDLEKPFSRKHCSAPKEAAQCHSSLNTPEFFLGTYRLVLKLFLNFIKKRKWNKMHYSKQLLLTVVSWPY